MKRAVSDRPPFSLTEHHPFACHKPKRGHAAPLNERHEPADFKEPSVKVFPLRVEMSLVDIVLLAEIGIATY